MYPARFWQVFLAAGLKDEKAREFLNALGPHDSDPTEIFLSWPKLTSQERANINRPDQNKVQRLLSQDVHVLIPPDYPDTLRQGGSPPKALFIRGNTECLHKPKIGIVGTRRATTQGKATAQKFAERLALAGMTIVSGGAFGIDAAAHRGALAVKKSTVCVLPCGVDVAQPPAHTQLLEDISNCGCLLSPYAIGTPTQQHQLLARNQLLASLVDAILIIEAPIPSGSLNTASHAANLNRPLFVVPGSINLDNYRGSHQLIRDGATLVDHPDQILEDLGHVMDLEIEEPGLNLNEVQQIILEMLGSEAITIEAISDETGLTTAELMSELTMMELDGLVAKHSGGYARI